MSKKLEKHIAVRIIQEWGVIAEKIIAESKPRSMQIEFSAQGAIALVGVRRCGKTSLALLEAKKISRTNYLYVNFEDPRFIEYNDFSVFDSLLEAYIENSKTFPEIIVFDELQNIAGWERWVRKFVDSKKKKLIITGSSAQLLSGELATSVAGRVLEYRVWPLSFKEFIQFKNSPSSQEKASFLPEFAEYGGFPEVVLTEQNQMKNKILQQYFTDILFKDVMARKGIRDRRTLEKIVYHYLTNVSCHHSYSALKKAYGLGGETPHNYTQHLQDAFLIFEVERYHKNLKVQNRDTKKVYTIDTGLRNVNSKSLSEDRGKLIENIVFLQLLYNENKVFFFKEKLETDFVLVKKNKPIQAIQVTDSDLEEDKLFYREVGGLVECLKYLQLKEGVILTQNRRESLSTENKIIRMIPVFDWLQSQ